MDLLRQRNPEDGRIPLTQHIFPEFSPKKAILNVSGGGPTTARGEQQAGFYYNHLLNGMGVAQSRYAPSYPSATILRKQ